MEYLILASAAANLLEKLIPQIRDAINNGEIPDDKLDEARAEYKRFRALGGDNYKGEDYELSGR